MSNSPLDIFRIRMKEIREKKNVTLKELAEYAGCKEATMQRYESGNGIKSVPYETVVSIAECLNVSPSYLMGWENSSEYDVELAADILMDDTMMEYVKKISDLPKSKREMVFSYIDFIINTK